MNRPLLRLPLSFLDSLRRWLLLTNVSGGKLVRTLYARTPVTDPSRFSEVEKGGGKKKKKDN